MRFVWLIPAGIVVGIGGPNAARENAHEHAAAMETQMTAVETPAQFAAFQELIRLEPSSTRVKKAQGHVTILRPKMKVVLHYSDFLRHGIV